jgi:protein-tyrosine phosphatase
LLLALMPLPAIAGTVTQATVERVAPDKLHISWADKDGVDVYMADRADATADTATLVSGNDQDGVYDQTVKPGTRSYFLLRDRKDGGAVRVAERLVPLEHGSNFRDIGGYPAAGGKHVRWGVIYRSGATPLLTDADVQEVKSLGLRNLVDLRSDEERAIAPSKIEGVPYNAVGYSMTAIMGGADKMKTAGNGEGVYRNLPTLLAPQMRILFSRLLAQEGPLAYNCSAGQDRTGFATALILTALGVPRDVIVADYHLSTGYRRPEYELPKIDPVAQANNPVAMYYAQYQKNPAAAKPQPLKTQDGTAFLSYAFDEIDKRYGSVENYLDKEAGVSAVDIAALRAAYLE